ncbi:hypothetical protein PQQ84_33705 [Paraburkholderia strydomiana]|uniref:hypothetical protein n=1 Tax=Paraburkholderia strydomiana TaxID=1245417 RepID=UPI0038BD9B01
MRVQAGKGGVEDVDAANLAAHRTREVCVRAAGFGRPEIFPLCDRQWRHWPRQAADKDLSVDTEHRNRCDLWETAADSRQSCVNGPLIGGNREVIAGPQKLAHSRANLFIKVKDLNCLLTNHQRESVHDVIGFVDASLIVEITVSDREQSGQRNGHTEEDAKHPSHCKEIS